MEVTKVPMDDNGFDDERPEITPLVYDLSTNETDRRQVTVQPHSELRPGTL